LNEGFKAPVFDIGVKDKCDASLVDVGGINGMHFVAFVFSCVDRLGFWGLGLGDETNVEALVFKHADGHLQSVVLGTSKVKHAHGEAAALGFFLGVLAAELLLFPIGRFDFRFCWSWRQWRRMLWVECLWKVLLNSGMLVVLLGQGWLVAVKRECQGGSLSSSSLSLSYHWRNLVKAWLASLLHCGVPAIVGFWLDALSGWFLAVEFRLLVFHSGFCSVEPQFGIVPTLLAQSS
jgi:hypothetical protein